MAQQPVGELKKLVSLVDRSAFDEFLYPANEKNTKFQPAYKPYHNFTHETMVLPFSGNPTWGQRLTFTVPYPWNGDFLSSLTFRFKPMSWYDGTQLRHISNDLGDFVPIQPQSMWIWAQSLGTIVIAKAEMEVDGIIVESFSGDWINVYNKTHLSDSEGVGIDDAVGSYTTPTLQNIYASEDGFIYCPLPFWFTKHVNTAFPLLSCSSLTPVRFHITLRPFHEVIRKIADPLKPCELPFGTTYDIRDYNYPFTKIRTITIGTFKPGFEQADIMCDFSHIDGELRKTYIETPHELYINPVTETVFNEPLKYVVNTTSADTIRINLPITIANGPVKQILFFVRRNAVRLYNEWNNYGSTLTGEVDPVWNPEKPLLERAQLMVGTAVWADEDERWWRASSILMPGGIRAYGNYIYGYNFAEKPALFGPSGSLNASRLDLKLNLTIRPPGGKNDTEWTVSVFVIGTNWFRFQNGIANVLFMD
jgi:hypothetical protein